MSKFQVDIIIDAGNVATALTSSVIDLRYNYGVAIQCTFTGLPTGSVVLEGSMDQTSWSIVDTLTVSGTNILSSNKDALYWPYLRVTKAIGGTGTMTVKSCHKGA